MIRRSNERPLVKNFSRKHQLFRGLTWVKFTHIDFKLFYFSADNRIVLDRVHTASEDTDAAPIVTARRAYGPSSLGSSLYWAPRLKRFASPTFRSSPLACPCCGASIAPAPVSSRVPPRRRTENRKPRGADAGKRRIQRSVRKAEVAYTLAKVAGGLATRSRHRSGLDIDCLQ